MVWDNTIADAPSQIHYLPQPQSCAINPRWGDPGVWLIGQKAMTPAVVEGDHNIEKKVHVSYRASTSQDAHDWLGCSSERRPGPKCHAGLDRGPEEDQSEDTPGRACFQWRGPNGCGGIIKMSWLSRMPSIYALCPKGSMRIFYPSWSQWHIELLLWMGVIGQQGTKAMPVPCPYYKNILVARNGQTDETIY